MLFTAPAYSFIRKVYGILATQLLITFGITFLFVFNNTWVVQWCALWGGPLYIQLD
jgi:FtsH-binding integral membrane protein